MKLPEKLKNIVQNMSGRKRETDLDPKIGTFKEVVVTNSAGEIMSRRIVSVIKK